MKCGLLHTEIPSLMTYVRLSAKYTSFRRLSIPIIAACHVSVIEWIEALPETSELAHTSAVCDSVSKSRFEQAHNGATCQTYRAIDEATLLVLGWNAPYIILSMISIFSTWSYKLTSVFSQL